MSKPREHRPPREGLDKVGYINGWPDSRGLPTIRVVCEGRRDKGTEHPETVVATFQCFPFDPSKGECGNWFWDANVATGGGKRHATTRIREEQDKARRRVTPEEEARGWRPGWVEVAPKLDVGMTQTGGTLHLQCPRCSSDLRLKEAKLQGVLDAVIVAGAGLDADMTQLLHVGARKLSLPALIALQTKPKSP